MCVYFRSRGFLTSQAEQTRYLNLAPLLPAEDGSLLVDPGNFCVYPVALDRVGQKAWSNPGRSPLRLEITLASPLEEKEKWYLVVLFEHAGRAEFERGKYKSEFGSFPWQK